jgi:nucleoside-diphosphate-sugar epimerase
MGELLKRIMVRMGVTKEIVTSDERMRPEKSEVLELICDNSQASELLSWTPTISLDDGIDSVIAYVARSGTDYKSGRYAV